MQAIGWIAPNQIFTGTPIMNHEGRDRSTSCAMALGKRWWWRPLAAEGGAVLWKWKWARTFRSGKGFKKSSSENCSPSSSSTPPPPSFSQTPEASAGIQMRRARRRRNGKAAEWRSTAINGVGGGMVCERHVQYACLREGQRCACWPIVLLHIGRDISVYVSYEPMVVTTYTILIIRVRLSRIQKA